MSVDFNNVFSLSLGGRMNRLDFFVSRCALVALAGVGGAIIGMTTDPYSDNSFPMLLLQVAVGVASFPGLVRRCHDLGHSAWWTLISLLPLSLLYFIFCFLVRSTSS